jgi:Type VI secretion system/phage-baseplate injector OB domain
MSECEKYFGLYRGTVVNNVDPERRGRLLVTVPDVLKLFPSTWAEPVVALGGPTGSGAGAYIVPPVGAGVWVQFEQGDINYPVWNGCRMNSAADVPPPAQLGNPVSPPVVIQSLGQQMIMISDVPPTPATGGIILKSTTNAMIVVNDSGIYISNGKGASIMLVGPSIFFNQTAMTIT